MTIWIVLAVVVYVIVYCVVAYLADRVWWIR